MEILMGDTVFTFMGESIVSFEVSELIDELRLAGGDGSCTYCVYREHCYHSQEEAIQGMLEALRAETECDCGEDEQQIEAILYQASQKFGWD